MLTLLTRVRPQSFEQFEEDFGSTRAAFFEYLTNGFYSRCSPDFYNLTGRKPTSYYDYLVNAGAAFTSAAQKAKLTL